MVIVVCLHAVLVALLGVGLAGAFVVIRDLWARLCALELRVHGLENAAEEQLMRRRK